MSPDELARACAQALYAEDRAVRELGIVVSDVAPGRATARMTVTPTMINGHAICHGGYVFLLADTAFGYACNSRGEVTVAAGGEVVFMAPTRLVAEAVERVRSGRRGVYDVTVRRAEREVVAEFRGISRSLGRKLVETGE